MPNYKRVKLGGATYFFTVVTVDRNPILIKPTVIDAMRNAILNVKNKYPFKIEAWVVMPDHMHCIWALPPGDCDYSKRWGLFKKEVSQKCHPELIDLKPSSSQTKRRELPFWQRRFWEHLIRDDKDYEKHMGYTHYNPVKHGVVKRVQDWPYSTFHKLVEQGVYPRDWGGDYAILEEVKFGE